MIRLLTVDRMNIENVVIDAVARTVDDCRPANLQTSKIRGLVGLTLKTRWESSMTYYSLWY